MILASPVRRRSVGTAFLVVALLATTAHADAGWELKLPAKLDVGTGTPATLPIAISLDRGLSVSKDAGVIVDLRAPAAIALKKRRLGRTDAVDPAADAPRFEVGVKTDAAGEHRVEIRVRFWLCGGRTCRPIDAKRAVIVSAAQRDGQTPTVPSSEHE